MDKEIDLITGLESQLQRTLRPIQADKNFVHTLQSRLIQSRPSLGRSHSIAPLLVALLMGLVAGALALWFYRRRE